MILSVSSWTQLNWAELQLKQQSKSSCKKSAMRKEKSFSMNLNLAKVKSHLGSLAEWKEAQSLSTSAERKLTSHLVNKSLAKFTNQAIEFRVICQKFVRRLVVL